MRARIAIACLVAGAPAARAAIVTREHGIDFVTIGDPGNRPVNALEGPEFFDPNAWRQPTLVGSVGYEYRMSRTEISVAQWFEFVKAYAPHYSGPSSDPQFTSTHIRPVGTLPSGVTDYAITPGAENYPADVSWRFAARYCNWMHNDRIGAAAAFEFGAYDTTTFWQNAQGVYQDQEKRSEGARYWIPSMDEWIKGMHWDPDKNGPGEGGYWYYPTSENGVPVSALPGSPGGQTATGLQPPPFWLAVGLYPETASPWGLLDGSGGSVEWLETLHNGTLRVRLTDGASAFSGLPPSQSPDRLDWLYLGIPNLSMHGVRLASAVPSPYSIVAFSIGVVVLIRKGRNL